MTRPGRIVANGMIAAVLVSLLLAAAARSATVNFVGQFSPASLPEGTAFALSGDQVTSFTATLKPTNCQSPADWANDSDAVFNLSLGAGASVPLTGGAFSYSGTATSSYPNGGYGSPYGGQFTITGTVNQSHTLVTANVALAGAHDPFVHGCSGTYKFIAIPSVTASNRRPDRAAYDSQFVSFDYAGGVVRNLEVQANFQCGKNAVDSAQFDAAAYGFKSIQTRATGAFRVQSYVLDEYKEILLLTVTGKVSGKKAKGRIAVSEPAGGYELIGSVGVCSGNYGWSATKPVPPPPPGPQAFFNWDEIRAPAGAAYRYYFALDSLTCKNGATEVLITVAGRTVTVPCSRSEAFASGPVAPFQTYQVRSQAVQTRGGRIVKRGASVTVPLAMAGPGDQWGPLTGGFGAPPS
jgi:hypothetical protein